MKSVRLLTPPPIGVGTRGEATVRIFGIAVDRPGHDHRVRAADPVRDPPRGRVHAAAASSPWRPGADGTTTIVRWDERSSPPVLPHLGALVLAPVLGADLPGRPRAGCATSSSRARGLSDATDAAPPRRRDVRAVPGALRAAAAGPRARRHHPVGRVRACATSCCTCSARRARRTSAAPRTGSSSRSATTSIPGYKSSAGMPPELLAQFPIAEAAVEALGHRPVADGRVRGRRRHRARPPSGSPRTRASSGSSSARRTRTWPSSSATTGSCCGTAAAASTYDDAGVRAKWGVPPTSIPDWLALVGDASDGYPGPARAGARSRPRRS